MRLPLKTLFASLLAMAFAVPAFAAGGTWTVSSTSAGARTLCTTMSSPTTVSSLTAVSLKSALTGFAKVSGGSGVSLTYIGSPQVSGTVGLVTPSITPAALITAADGSVSTISSLAAPNAARQLGAKVAYLAGDTATLTVCVQEQQP